MCGVSGVSVWAARGQTLEGESEHEWNVRCRIFDAALCPDGVLPQAEGVTHVGGTTADAVDFWL